MVELLMIMKYKENKNSTLKNLFVPLSIVKITTVFFYISCLLMSCKQNSNKKLFTLLNSAETGITFNNKITETDSFNIRTFEYIYNGGGIGIGDFNNDGRQDIFFAGNMVTSCLYLNNGDFHFTDVTDIAKVGTALWCTGVAVMDINQDGKQDIYVCTINPAIKKSSPNLLFLNKGNNSKGVPVFEEIAAKVGLNDSSYSTQAAFLDYDKDGDLDMYLVTNALESFNRNTIMSPDARQNMNKSIDKLFENKGLGPNGLPHFENVSAKAGIIQMGWGLGVAVTDANMDGVPDIYVANDFISNDLFYINNGNKTYTNAIETKVKHQSYNSMGCDIADINNDGLNDIITVDMMPEDNLRQKKMFNDIKTDEYQLMLQNKYQREYIRNMLQLNNGDGTYSDIGYLSGINATDWSWSPLIADFDNDGWRDILITNGYPKDITDLDFIKFNNVNFFGTPEEKLKKKNAMFNSIKGVKKPNCLFMNNHDLTFKNAALQNGLDQPSYSNGAVYADIDNDGDLDIIMNNINDKAFVYRNESISKKQNNTDTAAKTVNNFLSVTCVGISPNVAAFGAKVWLYNQGKIYQYSELWPQRGYVSSVEANLHFGIGSNTIIDSVKVIWSDGGSENINKVKANQHLVLYQKNEKSVTKTIDSNYLPNNSLFTDATIASNVFYKNMENEFVDFKYQNLLPHKHSQEGPGIAVGDINSDGLQDFFVGGSSGYAGSFFIQNKNAIFTEKKFLTKREEDMGVLLFDADGDGDTDLFCASGSSEFFGNTILYQSRLYKNDGKGGFKLDSTALPVMDASTCTVNACDYDKDGDLDLFIGGRITPGKYPLAPESYLLQNNGKGVFTNVTKQLAPQIQKAGMVSSAVWSDYDNDGWTDLLIAGEFMPVEIYKNYQGKFKRVATNLDNYTGWWNSLNAGDFDNDGDIDYIAGNLGLNSIYKATNAEPVSVYAKDYNLDGSIDPILARYISGTEYVSNYWGDMVDQMPGIRKSFNSYNAFGKADFENIFSKAITKDALILRANWFASSYIQNDGNGQFTVIALPVTAQFSPIYGTMVADINNDGNLDIIGVGNSYAADALSGWYDAGNGVCLLGNGKGGFFNLPAYKSGFCVSTDGKGLASLVNNKNELLLLSTSNRDSIKVFKSNMKSIGYFTSKLNNQYTDSPVRNLQRKQEFYIGAGYLSQSDPRFTNAPVFK
jgi:enediyne biosynthesis protein E4